MRATELKSLRFVALAVAFLFVVTAFSPLMSAKGIDLVTKDASLNGVDIANIVQLDPNDMLKKATDQETIYLQVNDTRVSFQLSEGSFLSSDYTITYPDGHTYSRSDGIKLPRFFSGTDVVGANAVTATIAGQWMHFSIDMTDGSYAVDAYDGTGASGYYAVFKSGSSDLNAADLVDESSIDTSMPSGTTIETVQVDNDTAAENASETMSEQSDSVASPMTVSYPDEHDSPLVRAYLYYDNAYHTLHGDISADIILGELWAVHDKFEHQAGVSFEVGHVGTIDTTNWNANNYQFWTSFMSYVANNTDVNNWDVAHLFTGRTLSGGNYYARESGAGMSKFYGSSAYNGYGASISQQTYSGSDENDWLLGHCIATSLNGDAAWATSTYDWMKSAYPGGGLSSYAFSTENINRILSFAQQVCEYKKIINYGPSSVWRDTMDNVNYVNVYVTNMAMTGHSVTQVGEVITFGFTIYNTGSVGINYYYTFIVGKSPTGNVVTSSDMSSCYVPAGGSVQVWRSLTLNEGGVWTIWPGLHNIVNGVDHWSPADWLDIHPTAYYTLNEWSGRYHSSDNLDLFYKWGVYSTARCPGLGNSIVAEYTMFNTASGTGTTSYNSMFVETRDPNDVCKDFGIVNGLVLTSKATGVVGGGYHGVAFTTVDVSGVWKMSPCYQTSGGISGPWMAPLLVPVDFFILPWSQMDNGLISLDNLGATYNIMLPTTDGFGALFSLGFRIFNFNPVETTLNCPTVALQVATLYEDRMDTTTDLYDPKNNCIISVKINIEKTIYSKYGVTFGSPGALTDSAVFWRIGSDQNKYAGGTNLYYPSQEFEPKSTMGDTALAVLSMMSEGVGLITGITDVLSGMAEMMGRVPLQDTKEIGLTDQSTAWAYWYTTQMSVHRTPVPDNSATYNYVDLPLHHTGDTYCYRINAEVTYVKKLSFSWDLGYYISSRETVTTPYIYIAIA